MSKAYMIDMDGNPIPMQQIVVKNEDIELQRILEANPDLLPGDQINPEDPRRWLTIKREMGVPDPASGVDRWSIDFVVVDQSAMPTFVECKRLKDSRSRHEVIGQMFDYAANGHYYWTKEEIEANAQVSAQAKGKTLEAALAELKPDDDLSVPDFFQRVEENLRIGQIRLVFFLEESPVELRSIVDFLNKQMERSEVLLVEARQYEHAGLRIVVPSLFGFTEQARAVKRRITVSSKSSSSSIKWDQDTFSARITEQLLPAEKTAIIHFLHECQNAGYAIKWGTGKVTGTFSVARPDVASKNLLVVYTDGALCVNFGYFETDFSEKFKIILENEAKLELPPDCTGKFPFLQCNKWTDKVDGLLNALKSLVQ